MDSGGLPGCCRKLRSGPACSRFWSCLGDFDFQHNFDFPVRPSGTVRVTNYSPTRNVRYITVFRFSHHFIKCHGPDRRISFYDANMRGRPASNVQMMGSTPPVFVYFTLYFSVTRMSQCTQYSYNLLLIPYSFPTREVPAHPP